MKKLILVLLIFSYFLTFQLLKATDSSPTLVTQTPYYQSTPLSGNFGGKITLRNYDFSDIIGFNAKFMIVASSNNPSLGLLNMQTQATSTIATTCVTGVQDLFWVRFLIDRLIIVCSGTDKKAQIIKLTGTAKGLDFLFLAIPTSMTMYEEQSNANNQYFIIATEKFILSFIQNFKLNLLMPNLLFGAMTPRTNSLAKIKSITYSGRKSFTACYDDGQVIRMQFSGFFGWSVTSYVFQTSHTGACNQVAYIRKNRRLVTFGDDKQVLVHNIWGQLMKRYTFDVAISDIELLPKYDRTLFAVLLSNGYAYFCRAGQYYQKKQPNDKGKNKDNDDSWKNLFAYQYGNQNKSWGNRWWNNWNSFYIYQDEEEDQQNQIDPEQYQCEYYLNTGITGTTAQIVYQTTHQFAVIGDAGTIKFYCIPGQYNNGVWNGTNKKCGCLDGYYNDDQSMDCLSCKPPCATCKDFKDFCLTCIDGRQVDANGRCMCSYVTAIYQDGKGHNSSESDSDNDSFEYEKYIKCNPCKKKWFYKSGLCRKCPDHCSRCTSDTECSKCQDSKNIVPNCGASCNYVNQNDLLATCQKCSDNCIDCDASGACLTCYNSLNLTPDCNSTTCPKGKYQTGMDCQPCDSKCDSCTDATSCVACKLTGFDPTTTCSTCVPKYYLSNQICTLCLSNCATCANGTTCLTCSNSLYLLDDCKSTTCPTGKYNSNPNAVSNKRCDSCPGVCQSCNIDLSCIVCTDPGKILPSCQNCKTNYYTVGGICKLCPTKCGTCQASGNDAICLTCATNGQLLPNCTSTTCNKGFYVSNSTCLACLAICDTCSNGTQCVTCLDQGKVAPACTSYGTDYYQDGNNQWKKCPSNCRTCSSQAICLTCANVTYLLPDCNAVRCAATFFNNSGMCTACISGCSVCSNNSTCSQCTDLGSNPSQNCTACLDGYYNLNNSCKACPSKCGTCNSANSCLTCKAINYLKPSCENTNCPQGWYISNGQCAQCNPSCQTCTTSNSVCTICADSGMNLPSCTTCQSNYVQINGVCNICSKACVTCSGSASNCTQCVTAQNLLPQCITNQCNAGFYNNLSGSCLPCLSKCSTCTDGSTCINCSSPGKISPVCTVCKSNFYASNNDCLPCPSACTACTSTTQCTGCVTQNMLFPLCVSNICAKGLYNDGQGWCQNCLAKCDTCSIGTTCIQCKFTGKIAPDCTACASSYYTSGDTCLPCPAQCGTCNSNGTQCLTCSNNLYLLPLCSSQNCPKGQYNNGSNVCVSCNNKCETCTTSADNCLVCLTAGMISPACTTCSSNYYKNDQGICIACDKTCGTCNSSGCITCSNNTFLTPLCNSTTCPSGQYKNSTTCSACPQKCRSCSSSTDCTECTASGFAIPACTSCQSNYYTSGNNCLICPSNCLTCNSGDSTTCLTCANSNLKPLCNSQTCPQGQYNNNGTCQACNIKCSSCSNSTSCNICATDGYLEPDCTTCKSFYFMNNNNLCQICSKACGTCQTTFDNCLTCSNATYLLPSCISNSCLAGKYINGNACSSCDVKCQSCQDNATNCLVCADATLQSPTCITCKSGYYLNSTCLKCPYQCLTCSWDGTNVNCLACNQQPRTDTLVGTTVPITLKYLLPSCLVIQCPNGQYLSNDRCLNCLDICSTCSNNTSCQTCQKTGYSPPSCNSCKTGYYQDLVNQDNINGFCFKCNDKCNGCTTTSTTCISCSNTSYLLPDCNSTICSSGKYNNAGVCTQCQSKCLTCSSSTTCLQCTTAGYLPPNCLTCQSNYYMNANVCTICPSKCRTCTTNGVCLTCNNNLFLLPLCTGNSCPDNQYNNSGVCTNCPVKCKSCLSATSCKICSSEGYSAPNCTDCITGYFMLNNVCTKCASQCSTCSTSSINCLICAVNQNIVPSCNSSTCSIGQYKSGQTCISCLQLCSACSNNTSCDVCLASGFASPNCTTCQSNYYSLNNACISCPKECATCSYDGTVAICTSCSQNTFLLPSCTSTTCLSNQFNNNGTCQSCLDKCATCTNGSSCTNCKQQTYQSPDCTSCKTGTYLSDIQTDAEGYCHYCSNQCSTCQTSSDNCLTCTNSSYLKPFCNNSVCPIGYYNNSGTCTLCQNICRTCTNGTSCTECLSAGYAAPSCTNCQTSYWMNNTVCTSCPSNCSSCTSNGQTCTQCAVTTFLLPLCVGTVCPSNQYNLSGVCTNCQTQCQTCSNGTSCSTCAQEGFQAPNCTSCLNGYYATGNTCTRCSEGCQTCSISSTNCTLCSQQNFLIPSCEKSTCPTGFYISGITCAPCQSKCLSCSATTTCDICSADGFAPPICQGCLSNYYLAISGNSITCNICPTKCATCSLQNSNPICNTCSNSTFVLPYCVATTCNRGEWNNNGTCQACQNICSICSSGTSCTYCTLTGYLPPNCTTCQTGFYWSDTPVQNNYCKPCLDKCASCSNGTSCLSCANQTFVLPYCNSTTCPTGEYINQNICNTCSDKCQSCITSSTNCIVCFKSGMAAPNCTVCQTNYLSTLDGGCQICNSKCASCSGTVDNCLTCSNSTYVLPDCNSQNCPLGKYLNTTNKTCFICNAKCSSCTDANTCIDCNQLGRNPPSCTLCKSNFWTSGSTCVQCNSKCGTCSSTDVCLTCADPTFVLPLCNSTTCLQGFYNSNNTCLACLDKCLECTNSTSCTICKLDGFAPGNCTACKTNYFKAIDNTCQQCNSKCTQCTSTDVCILACTNNTYVLPDCVSNTCNSGYYLNATNNTCTQCASICKTCSNSTQCLICNDDGKSAPNCQTCQSSYWNNNGNCLKCHNKCGTCTSTEVCITCSNPAYLLPSCNSDSCPSNQFQSVVNSQQTCLNCNDACASCSGSASNCLVCTQTGRQPNSCTQCSSGYWSATVSSSLPCTKCQQNCGTCNNDLCTTCANNANKLPRCEATECRVGEYEDAQHYCNLCQQICTTCSNNSSCDTCQDNTKAAPNCVNCKSNYFTTNDNQCSICLEKCLTCSGNTNCLTCVNNTYKKPYCDAQNCPAGEWSDNTNTCQPCLATCETCSDGSSCLTCQDPALDPATNCESCLSIYFVNQDQQCQKCNVLCLTCSDTTSCNTCVDTQQNSPHCIACNIYEFSILGQCVKCESQCATCSDLQTCISCTSDAGNPPSCDPVLCDDGFYRTKVNGINVCKPCNSKCATCDGTSTNCTSCAGDTAHPPFCVCPFNCHEDQCDTATGVCFQCYGNRQLISDCGCPDKSYEDNESQICPTCNDVCNTCLDNQTCETCDYGRDYNKDTQQCTCTRRPPTRIKSYFCVTCQQAFPLIKFSDDLNFVEINFDYTVKFSSQNPTISSYKNCQILLQDSSLVLFGTNPKCYQSTDRQILIELGQNSSVKLQDELEFNLEVFYEPTCTSVYLGATYTQYIAQIFTPAVQGPIESIIPYVTFDYPLDVISLCATVQVSVLEEFVNAQRSLTRNYWGLVLVSPQPSQQHLDFLTDILGTFTDKVVFGPNQLLENSIYVFSLNAKNVAGTVGESQFIIQTGTSSMPLLQINFDKTKKYLKSDSVPVPVFIQGSSCQNGVVANLQQSFDLQLSLVKTSDSSTAYTASGSVPIGTNNINFTIPPFSAQVQTSYQIQVVAMSTSGDSVTMTASVLFKVTKQDIIVEFLTGNLMMQEDLDLDLQALVSDPDLENSQDISQIDIAWTCINLYNNLPCMKQNGQPLTFEDGNIKQVITAHSFPPNYIYQVTITASQGTDRKTSKSIQILVSTLPVGIISVNPKEGKADGVINVTERIAIKLKKPPRNSQVFYAFFIFQFEIIGTVPITSSSLRIKLLDFKNEYIGSKTVLVFIIPYAESIKLEINYAPTYCTEMVAPSTGNAFFAKFLFRTLYCKDDTQPLHYSWYYYLDEEELNEDKLNLSTDHGFVMSNPSQSEQLQQVLPDGILINNKVWVLGLVEDDYGARALLSTQVTVLQGIVNNLKEAFYNYDVNNKQLEGNQATVSDKIYMLHTNIIDMYGLGSRACSINCSGHGKCNQDGKTCTCDSGYFYDDCSGNQDDYKVAIEFLSRQLTIINQLYTMVDPNNSMDNYLLIKVSKWLMDCKYKDDMMKSLPESTLTESVQNFQTYLQQKAAYAIIALQNAQLKPDGEFSIQREVGGSNSDSYDAFNVAQQIFGGKQVNGTQYDQKEISKKLPPELQAKDQLYSSIISLQDSVVTSFLATMVPDDPPILLQGRTLTTEISRLSGQNCQDKMNGYNSKNKKVRVLAQKSATSSLNLNNDYDITKVTYATNPYQFDGFFKYPGTTFPVIYIKVTLAGTSTVVKLTEPVIQTFDVTKALSGYSADMIDRPNVVCISRDDEKFVWDNKSCKTDLYAQNNNLFVDCSCTGVTTITAVNDFLYVYVKEPVKLPFILPQYAIYIILGIITGLYIISTMWGIRKDKYEGLVVVPLESPKEQGTVIENPNAVRKQNRMKTQSKARNMTTSSLILGPNNPRKTTKTIQANDNQSQAMSQIYTEDDQDRQGSPDQKEIGEDLQSQSKVELNIQAKSKRKAQIVKEGQKNKNRITAWMEKVVKDERIANLWTRIKNFHSIVEPYFIYKKEIPRAFRFTVLFLRFMFMCAVSGVLARMSVDFAVFAGILAATSLLMRFVSMKLNDLIKRSHENHRWRGCQRLIVVFIMLILALCISGGYYTTLFKIEPYKQIYWGVGFVLVCIFDVGVLDTIMVIVLPHIKEKLQKDQVKVAPLEYNQNEKQDKTKGKFFPAIDKQNRAQSPGTQIEEQQSEQMVI